MEEVLLGLDFISSAFGYILWFLFEITKNYGVAIILFTIIINFLTVPLVIKRIRSVPLNEKFEAKKEKLRKKFANDPRRFNQEVLELSQREGVNPFKNGGLSTNILTFLIFGLIYASVNHPLTNVLHLPKQKVVQASEVLTSEQRQQKGSDELDLVRSFEENKSKLTMFDNEEIEKISEYSKGFSFLGLNLLNIPKFSKFGEYLWIFPLLSFVFSILGNYVIQKISGTFDDVKGAGRVIICLISLFQAWIVSRIFAAVGLYFIVNGIVSNIQVVFLDNFFSPYIQRAKREKKLFDKIMSEDKN